MVTQNQFTPKPHTPDGASLPEALRLPPNAGAERSAAPDLAAPIAGAAMGVGTAEAELQRLLEAASAPTMLDAALVYHALGYTVIPILKGKKIPGISGWQHLRPTADDLRLYFATGKYGGFGVRPGALSGNRVCIDADTLLSYTAFSLQFPSLANTLTELSGGGEGRHVWLQVKQLPELPTTKLKRKIVVDGQETSIELFWDSGQVVVAPSVHPSGNRYTIEKPLPILEVDNLDDLITWIFSLAPEDERASAPTEPQRPAVPTSPGANRRYALKALNGMSADVARLTNIKDDYQNDTCYKGVFKAAHYAQRSDLARGEVHAAFESAMRSNGYIGAFGYTSFAKTFESGWSGGLSDTSYVPRCYQEGFKASKPKKSVRRRLEKEALRIGIGDQAPADHSAYAKEVVHVSDDLTPDEIALHPTLLVEGGTGLGKSTAIAAYLSALTSDQPITAMAQFRLLTSALHKLLEGFAHYEQADGAHQRALGRLKKLVTSLSSLAKFDRHGGYAILDEITGILKFLAESGTFRGGEALAAFRALVTLIESAVQLIGMDANLDDITIRFIEKYRGRATVKRYRRAQPRGKVTLLTDPLAAVYTIGKLLAHKRGLVFAPCSSEVMTTQITEHFTALGYKVLKITRDTSNTETVKRAVRDAAFRATFDLIPFDSACGAGVDFSEQAYAEVAIFGKEPLAPEDAIQVFGRVRHAQRRYAAVPAESEGYPTATAQELLGDVLKREVWTARLLKVNQDTAGDMLELAQLWSEFRARRLRESARWRHYFAHRLQADGFTVAEINVRAPEAFAETWKAWKADRADQQWAFVKDAVDRALPDDDLDRLRLAGVEITTEHHLLNRRYQIEDAKANAEVTEHDRDLMKHNGLRGLFHLRDWFSVEDDLRAADQQQHAEGLPIYKRRYSALAREVLAALFKLAGHDGTPEQQLAGFIDTFRDRHSAGEINERYAAFATPEAMSKFKALGHRGNNAKTVSGLCRWLMDYFGLKLVSDRKRIDGKLTMHYQIDTETLDYRIERARHAARERRVIRNVHSSLKCTKVISHQQSPTTDAERDWAASPAEFESRFGRGGWLTAPIGAYT